MCSPGRITVFTNLQFIIILSFLIRHYTIYTADTPSLSRPSTKRHKLEVTTMSSLQHTLSLLSLNVQGSTDLWRATSCRCSSVGFRTSLIPSKDMVRPVRVPPSGMARVRSDRLSVPPSGIRTGTVRPAACTAGMRPKCVVRSLASHYHHSKKKVNSSKKVII
jgi:hypothetical protein